jgi:hypothetical protein
MNLGKKEKIYTKNQKKNGRMLRNPHEKSILTEIFYLTSTFRLMTSNIAKCLKKLDLVSILFLFLKKRKNNRS